mmetsp:Transcript_54043/g.171492  ORF Transcript_54043/g.171492 Transcript_54043/m.171492 type:complete len:258 (+) Transcript_54043:1273-2046(+)
MVEVPHAHIRLLDVELLAGDGLQLRYRGSAADAAFVVLILRVRRLDDDEVQGVYLSYGCAVGPLKDHLPHDLRPTPVPRVELLPRGLEDDFVVVALHEVGLEGGRVLGIQEGPVVNRSGLHEALGGRRGAQRERHRPVVRVAVHVGVPLPEPPASNPGKGRGGGIQTPWHVTTPRGACSGRARQRPHPGGVALRVDEEHLLPLLHLLPLVNLADELALLLPGRDTAVLAHLFGRHPGLAPTKGARGGAGGAAAAQPG